jgi:isoaspartyl peptidase/L-asparaginase-like protein (Ntn-hydrolase superfamily)
MAWVFVRYAPKQPQPRAFRGTAAKEFPILLASAARAALASVPRLGGDGGLVAVDRRGNIAMPFNSQGMYRACIDRRGRRTIVIYR